MKLRSTLLSVGVAFLGTTVAVNGASLLTLDNLPAGGPADIYPPVVPNGYGGLSWNNFAVVNGLEFDPSYSSL